MLVKKTRVYKFPVGSPVVISTSASQHKDTRGKIYGISDPLLTLSQVRDHLEEDRAPVTGEVQYSVIIKNTQTKAQFLAEDEDNEAEEYPEYEVAEGFYASDLRRDGF